MVCLVSIPLKKFFFKIFQIFSNWAHSFNIGMPFSSKGRLVKEHLGDIILKRKEPK